VTFWVGYFLFQALMIVGSQGVTSSLPMANVMGPYWSEGDGCAPLAAEEQPARAAAHEQEARDGGAETTLAADHRSPHANLLAILRIL